MKTTHFYFQPASGPEGRFAHIWIESHNMENCRLLLSTQAFQSVQYLLTYVQ